ncbi:hypothetical protein ZOSMA_239G00020 [Zostera marina]|uniref:Uncharacterized protein n=1 Tax=Zostera marina TaxID=29655 RepID=A0A0K9PJT0_ZOSMR|nr:hypothetical protein ZOSMA_239G00020 [Zostera marina]
MGRAGKNIFAVFLVAALIAIASAQEAQAPAPVPESGAPVASMIPVIGSFFLAGLVSFLV